MRRMARFGASPKNARRLSVPRQPNGSSAGDELLLVNYDTMRSIRLTACGCGVVRKGESV